MKLQFDALKLKKEDISGTTLSQHAILFYWLIVPNVMAKGAVLLIGNFAPLPYLF